MKRMPHADFMVRSLAPKCRCLLLLEWLEMLGGSGKETLEFLEIEDAGQNECTDPDQEQNIEGKRGGRQHGLL